MSRNSYRICALRDYRCHISNSAYISIWDYGPALRREEAAVTRRVKAVKPAQPQRRRFPMIYHAMRIGTTRAVCDCQSTLQIMGVGEQPNRKYPQPV